MEKTDAALGAKVHEHLVSVGLETPMNYEQVQVKDEKKIKVIAKHFTAIMEELGLDLTDDSLIDTPNRVAKMYVREIFTGLNYDNFPKCTRIENKMGENNSFVLERNVNVQSNCEHHFVVIDGKATVAYIPKKTILGLSKLNRIVQFFSKRPQVQERLTMQIGKALQTVLQTQDVAVFLDAKHLCVNSRGIRDIESSTVTSEYGGKFKNESTKREFLDHIKLDTKF